jgi:hypothetical protein
MAKTGRVAAVLALGALLAAGCSGNLGSQVMSNPEIQQNIMGTIASHGNTAAAMMDHLLVSDSIRAVVIEKVLASGPASQQLMLAMAKDPTMVDGVINLAVQDSSMKDHVLTLFRGMQMAGLK